MNNSYDILNDLREGLEEVTDAALQPIMDRVYEILLDHGVVEERDENYE